MEELVLKGEEKAQRMEREKRKQIQFILQSENLTQTWLINRLELSGIEASKANLSDVLRGVRKGEKATEIIDKSLDILNGYLSWANEV